MSSEVASSVFLDVELRDGTRVRLRPIRPDDKDLLQDGMHHLSPESRYRRFFTAIDELSPTLLAYLTEIDYVNHFAWIALALDEPGEPAVGVARYIRRANGTGPAEVAVTVRDDYQDRGLGTLLLDALGVVARSNGVDEFTAVVLSDNGPMRQLLQEHGIALAFEPGSAELRGTGPTPETRDDLTNEGLHPALCEAAGNLAPNRISGPSSALRRRGGGRT